MGVAFLGAKEVLWVLGSPHCLVGFISDGSASTQDAILVYQSWRNALRYSDDSSFRSRPLRLEFYYD